MKKFLLALVAIVMSASMVFADVDAWNLPDVITGANSVKFKLDRVELIAGPEMVRIGVGILNVSRVFDNYLMVRNGDQTATGTQKYDKGFAFLPRLFAGVGMKFGGVGLGIGYQISLARDVYSRAANMPVYASKQIATTHGIVLAATLLEDKLLLNLPIFIGAANAKVYGIDVSTTAGKEDYKAPLVFGIQPYIKYVFGDGFFNYIKGTFKYNMISGKIIYDEVTNEPKNVTASSLTALIEFQMTYKTDPVLIYSEPAIQLDMGFNSTGIIDASDAQAMYAGFTGSYNGVAGASSWFTYYTPNKNDSILQLALKFPVRFQGKINDSVTLYGQPALHIGYKSNGWNDGVNRSTFGLAYALLIGTVYNPVENLEVGLELQATGRAADTTIAFANTIPSGTSLASGLDAWVTYRF